MNRTPGALTVPSIAIRQAAAGARTQGAQGFETVARDDQVAEEIPVALVFNALSHAVMMATPADLEDFAVGFAFTEQIVAGMSDVRDLSVRRRQDGAEVELEISPQCLWRLKERRRAMTGRTGCGICGIESLQAFQRPVPRVQAPLLSTAAILRAQRELGERQPLRSCTGATHAAGWCSLDGEVLLVREDVGRHNALDKLIGALLQQDGHTVQPWQETTADATGTGPTRHGFAIVSSRASYEMVDKTARASIGALAAVSAPTSLAVARARESGMLLAAFVRDSSLTLYSGNGLE